jgi:hypothetical protein
MQLCLVFEEIEPAAAALPAVCPVESCGGTAFRLHQQVVKPLRDPVYHTIVVGRYQCVGCGHTFRVYPQGVTHAHTSQWIHKVAAALYLLGLSYGAVSSVLDVLKIYVCKSRVHAAVQIVQAAQPHLVRTWVFGAVHSCPQQDRALRVRCMGQWLPLTLITDGHSGLALTVATLSPEAVAELHAHIEPVITPIGGYVLLNDAHGNDDEQGRSTPYI